LNNYKTYIAQHKREQLINFYFEIIKISIKKKSRRATLKENDIKTHDDTPFSVTIKYSIHDAGADPGGGATGARPLLKKGLA
jgi:hypothetical protein